jgi:hypothetical protein
MIIRQTRDPAVWLDEQGRVGPRAFLLGLALEAGRRRGGHVSCVGFDESVVEHWSFKRLPTGVFHPVKEDPRFVRLTPSHRPPARAAAIAPRQSLILPKRHRPT